MKLSQLRIFVAVAETGSFSAAAAELGCTQSRVSHAIAELERALGARLLHRSHAGSAPTAVGHQALEKAKRMLALERDLIDTARPGRAVAGHVRIACFRSIGTHLLPHALEKLARDYPGLRVDIDDSCEEREDIVRAVADGRAELGVAQAPVPDAFSVQPYLHDDYVFVVPAGRGLAAPLAWRDLDGLPYIQLACSGALGLVRECRAAGFTAAAERTLANDTSIAAMVGRGMGYSILPRLAVFPAPDDVATVALPIPAARRLALIALPDTMRDPAAQIVRRYLGDPATLRATAACRAGVIALD